LQIPGSKAKQGLRLISFSADLASYSNATASLDPSQLCSRESERQSFAGTALSDLFIDQEHKETVGNRRIGVTKIVSF